MTLLDRRARRFVLPLACTGSFLVIMDATIVAVALPTMGADLGIEAAALPWVVNAYTLAFAGFLLLGGRIADLAGPRATLVGGLVLFGGASAAGGLATVAPMLFAARAIQGLGGALLFPSTVAVITAAYDRGPARTRALAVWSVVGAAGATVGTILGGVLTQWAGWRWVLLVAVPPATIAITLALVAAPRRSVGPSNPLDVLGALLATAGLTALVYAIMESEPHGVGAPDVLGAFALGAVLLAGFTLHQSRWSHHPLVPPGMVRLPGVAAANLVIFCTGLAFFATPVLLALYVQRELGFDPLLAGLGLVPLGLALVVGGRSAATLTVRWGPRRAAVLGLAVSTLGFAGLAAGAAAGAGYLVAVCLPSLLVGLGTGAAFTPVTVVATDHVPPDRQGLAAGILNTTRQVSAAIGLAALSSIVLTLGFWPAFACALACCAVSVLLAVAVLPAA